MDAGFCGRVRSWGSGRAKGRSRDRWAAAGPTTGGACLLSLRHGHAPPGAACSKGSRLCGEAAARNVGSGGLAIYSQ